MVASDSLPEMFRASDEDRDEVIRMLREGSAEGRLSQETFLARVDSALQARSARELAGLHRDLPPPERRIALRDRVSRWCQAMTDAARATLPAPQIPRLVLPRGPKTAFTIGRSPGCDLPLGDPTVSWVHAELRLAGDSWMLADLDSRNGTRVNGWRVDEGFIVAPGDRVRFGRAEYRLASRW